MYLWNRGDLKAKIHRSIIWMPFPRPRRIYPTFPQNRAKECLLSGPQLTTFGQLVSTWFIRGDVIVLRYRREGLSLNHTFLLWGINRYPFGLERTLVNENYLYYVVVRDFSVALLNRITKWTVKGRLQTNFVSIADLCAKGQKIISHKKIKELLLFATDQ